MPRFIVFVPASAESEAGQLPDTQSLDAMTKFNEELSNAGLMLDGAGLKPSSEGKRIRFEGNKATVLDGPFTEAKELVAGFWMLQATSIDEVTEWLKKAPFGPGVEIQIRPVFEPEDFGDALTPEIRERNERIRVQNEKR